MPWDLEYGCQGYLCSPLPPSGVSRSHDCWAFTLFRLFLTTVTLLFLDLRLSTVQQGSQFEVRELVDHNDSGLGTGA